MAVGEPQNKPSKSELDILYSAFLRAENKVGGGEGLVGIYGSMTQQGTSAILDAMARETGLGPSSVLVDIGSGLCRPLLHAVLQLNVKMTYGVELDPVKCQKAVPFVKHVSSMLESEGVEILESSLPVVICSSVEQLGSLEPATHAYAAWEGFPVEAKKAVGALFACTPSLRAITIVQRYMRQQDPARVMEDLGFGRVRHVNRDPIPVHMAGSGRRLNAYVFIKEGDQCSQQGKSGNAGRSVNKAGSKAGCPATGPSLALATPFQLPSVTQCLAGTRESSGGAHSGDSTCTATAAACEPGDSTTTQAPAHSHRTRSRSKAQDPCPQAAHQPRASRSGARTRQSSISM